MTAPGIPPNLLAVLTGNETFPTEDGITAVEWIDIGVLPVPTGQIITCDPLVFDSPNPFERTIDRGAYPVRILVAHIDDDDQRIAAGALIVDDSALPAEWLLATTSDQDVADLGPDELYGYAVDSGTAGFLDVDAAHALEEAMDDDSDYFERIIADLNATYEHTRSWTMHPIGGDPDICLAAFSSGFGDGLYPTYWGLDSSGRVQWLLTEFGLF